MKSKKEVEYLQQVVAHALYTGESVDPEVRLQLMTEFRILCWVLETKNVPPAIEESNDHLDRLAKYTGILVKANGPLYIFDHPVATDEGTDSSQETGTSFPG